MKLQIHPAAPAAVTSVIESHLTLLGLQGRFQKFFKTEYIRVLKLANRARERRQNVKQKLEEFQTYAADRALNSWEHILFEGVNANLELVDYLEVGFYLRIFRSTSVGNRDEVSLDCTSSLNLFTRRPVYADS